MSWYILRSRIGQMITISKIECGIEQEYNLHHTLHDIANILSNSYMVDIVHEERIILRPIIYPRIKINIANDLFNIYDNSNNILDRCIREILSKINTWCNIM